MEVSYYPGCSLHSTAAEYDHTVRAAAQALDLELINQHLVRLIGGEEVRLIIPVEGAAAWVDTMAIPSTVEHPCTAQTFINFMLDPFNGAELTNYNYYASPNEAAEEYIWEEILEWDRISDGSILDELESHTEFRAMVGGLNHTKTP